MAVTYPALQVVIYEYENKTVFEQAVSVAECLVIVHPHGGGMTNMMFLHPSAKVTEVFPFGYTPVPYFSRLVLSSGAKYKSMLLMDNQTVLTQKCHYFKKQKIDSEVCMADSFCRSCYKDGKLIVDSSSLTKLLVDAW